MLDPVSRNARDCPVCGAHPSRSALFLEGNIDRGKVNEFSFASRKQPEFMSHRMTRCLVCDVVYAPQPPSHDDLAESYHRAAFDSAREAEDAAASYLTALIKPLCQLPQREVALEIGAGTGAFLARLAERGFTQLVGVEPSRAAIDAAQPARRSLLREGVFDATDFAPESFDLIACFMTLEHVRDPGTLVRQAHRLLRPGGQFVAVTHDYRALLNRVLGRRSPIIDIEHLQLFSKRSIGELFSRAGYDILQCTSFTNTYALDYWLRLTPLPPSLKAMLSHVSRVIGLAEWKLAFNVGNTMCVASKKYGEKNKD
jgi:SAM-dependent methyltransferase